MPWHQLPMKDAISCDKLRLGANIRLTRRFPNVETRLSNTQSSMRKYIAH